MWNINDFLSFLQISLFCAYLLCSTCNLLHVHFLDICFLIWSFRNPITEVFIHWSIVFPYVLIFYGEWTYLECFKRFSKKLFKRSSLPTIGARDKYCKGEYLKTSMENCLYYRWFKTFGWSLRKVHFIAMITLLWNSDSRNSVRVIFRIKST